MPVDPADSAECERLHTTICGKQGGNIWEYTDGWRFPMFIYGLCTNDVHMDLWIACEDYLLVDSGILRQIEVLGAQLGWNGL